MKKIFLITAAITLAANVAFAAGGVSGNKADRYSGPTNTYANPYWVQPKRAKTSSVMKNIFLNHFNDYYTYKGKSYCTTCHNGGVNMYTGQTTRFGQPGLCSSSSCQ